MDTCSVSIFGDPVMTGYLPHQLQRNVSRVQLTQIQMAVLACFTAAAVTIMSFILLLGTDYALATLILITHPEVHCSTV